MRFFLSSHIMYLMYIILFNEYVYFHSSLFILSTFRLEKMKESVMMINFSLTNVAHSSWLYKCTGYPIWFWDERTYINDVQYFYGFLYHFGPFSFKYQKFIGKSEHFSVTLSFKVVHWYKNFIFHLHCITIYYA